jgi:hypothetical protein
VKEERLELMRQEKERIKARKAQRSSSEGVKPFDKGEKDLLSGKEKPLESQNKAVDKDETSESQNQPVAEEKPPDSQGKAQDVDVGSEPQNKPVSKGKPPDSLQEFPGGVCHA